MALSVTGQGDGTWLIDSDGENRCMTAGFGWTEGLQDESREINASDGLTTIFDKTGSGVTVCQMRTQLRWMKRHAPELLDRATTAFPLQGLAILQPYRRARNRSDPKAPSRSGIFERSAIRMTRCSPRSNWMI